MGIKDGKIINSKDILNATTQFLDATLEDGVYKVTFEDLDDYFEGLKICIKCIETNTGVCRININNIGEKRILDNNQLEVMPGIMKKDKYYLLMYDGGYFRLERQVYVGEEPLNTKSKLVLPAINEIDSLLGERNFNTFSKYVKPAINELYDEYGNAKKKVIDIINSTGGTVDDSYSWEKLTKEIKQSKNLISEDVDSQIYMTAFCKIAGYERLEENYRNHNSYSFREYRAPYNVTFIIGEKKEDSRLKLYQTFPYILSEYDDGKKLEDFFSKIYYKKDCGITEVSRYAVRNEHYDYSSNDVDKILYEFPYARFKAIDLGSEAMQTLYNMHFSDFGFKIVGVQMKKGTFFSSFSVPYRKISTVYRSYYGYRGSNHCDTLFCTDGCRVSTDYYGEGRAGFNPTGGNKYMIERINSKSIYSNFSSSISGDYIECYYTKKI